MDAYAIELASMAMGIDVKPHLIPTAHCEMWQRLADGMRKQTLDVAQSEEHRSSNPDVARSTRAVETSTLPPPVASPVIGLSEDRAAVCGTQMTSARCITGEVPNPAVASANGAAQQKRKTPHADTSKHDETRRDATPVPDRKSGGEGGQETGSEDLSLSPDVSASSKRTAATRPSARQDLVASPFYITCADVRRIRRTTMEMIVSSFGMKNRVPRNFWDHIEAVQINALFYGGKKHTVRTSRAAKSVSRKAMI